PLTEPAHSSPKAGAKSIPVATCSHRRFKPTRTTWPCSRPNPHAPQRRLAVGFSEICTPKAGCKSVLPRCHAKNASRALCLLVCNRIKLPLRLIDHLAELAQLVRRNLNQNIRSQ